MAAPKEIVDLIDKFDSDPDFYRSNYFNETEVRTQFINPFFEALGWDIYHKCYPDNRDVKEEDSIEVEGKTKNPDYSFRLFKKRKFFVEVKRPSINIESGVYPAYQIRRYAWSADLPISILTDFEEFSVYYCRSKPSKDDKPTKQRLLYFRYDQYAEKWPEIAALFSREAVLKGSLDNYVGSLPQRRGEKRVDAALLDDISKWREMLAKNIALRNPELDTASLNYSVQAIIDRIMFLRICEDRGIERYMRLKDLLTGERVYPRLFELFRQADERYNSGIFHFKKEPDRLNPDIITPNLNIDDKILKDIIKQLYFPESPYAFSVLPAEILGQIYEQFLGKVIRLTEGHHAVVEDKPEVKKAGGVKYTPVYIVEDIVGNTLGIMLKGKTPIEVVLISVLDPACGSGSFLIVAYQYLLDWHRDWYVQNLVPLLQSGLKPSSPEIRRLLPGADMSKKERKKEPELPIYQGRDGEWRLTTAERKRILLNNIYGVDIDRQAVEVTKLSLLLKVLEGENDETISKQLTLFQERALPDLGNNIKCGNSLIGWDILEDNPSLTQEEIERINPFDWEKEFPEIFKRGRFSVVIGNPPYSYMISEIEQNYFQNKYKHQNYQKDLYLLFLERYEHFLKHDGLLGVIVSNTWLLSVTYEKIRIYLTTQYRWLRIVYLPEKVFDAVVDTHVLIFQRKESDGTGILTVDIRRNNEITAWHKLPESHIPKDGSPINITAPVEAQNLIQKIIETSRSMNQFCAVFNGTKPFEKGKGTPPQTEKTMKEKPYVIKGGAPDSSWSPLLRGSLIHRYQNRWKGDYWIQYGPWLAAPRDPKIFDAPLKIVVRQTGDSIIATLVECGYISRDNLHILILRDAAEHYDLRYLLGLMNSSLMDFAYTLKNPEKGEALAQVKKYHVEQLPIRTIDFSDPADVARHDRMVSLVDQILSLHKQLQEARTPHEQTSLQRQIDAIDNQIDALVYKLYGLTEEEIRIVERT